MAFTPVPCTDCGSGDTGGPGQSGFDSEQQLLCDVLADGTIAGTAIMVTIYSESGGNPVGPPTAVDPVTGDTYVPQGVLQPCSTPNPPVFAGFVCDVFGGAAEQPAIAPTCPGSPLAAPLSLNTNDLTEAPAGTYTPSGTGPFLSWSRSPSDAQHAICAVRFVNDPGTGDDPFWQLGGSFVDAAGNGQNLIDPWISAIEAALGVSDVSDIPAGSTATAPIAGTNVTITFEGPSNRSQMFAGNGAFFVREQDGDGLAAGVTLKFDPPIQSFQIFANVQVPTPGSFSGLQESTAAPGTAAVPAQPAGIFRVKQFRNPDGTSFYENLDGTGHPVLGQISECGDYFQEVLCASGVPFVRVYKISGGAVASFQDYDLTGALFAPAGNVGICTTELATYRHTPVEVLCYTAVDGVTVTQFLRRYLIEQDGVNVVAIVDTLLDGTTPFVAVAGGTVAECGGDCAATTLGTVCYTPPSTGTPSVPLTDDFTGSLRSGVAPGVITQTVPNFGGSAFPLVLTKTNSAVGPVNSFAQLGLLPGTAHVTLDLGQPLTNVTVHIFAFDTTDAEQLRNISPAFTGLTGNGTAVLANTGVDATLPQPPSGPITLQFAGPVQHIAFDYLHNASAGIGLDVVTGDTVPVTVGQTIGTAAVVRDCSSGAITYVDLATGDAIDISSVTIVDCGDMSNPVTLSAQARLLTNAAPWTPGADVVGSLTALTVTGVTGTWSVTDANGTVLAGLPAGLSLSWAAADDGSLTGPQSITPAAAGSVVAAWTQKP